MPTGRRGALAFAYRHLAAGLVLAALTGATLAADLTVMQIAPYSGPDASIGREYGEGARLYFEHVNAHGGIHGAKITLVAKDDAGDPKLTRRQADVAAKEKPLAFIGTVGMSSVESLVPTLARLGAPLLGPVVDVAAVDASHAPHVFHVRPAVRQETEAIAARLYALGMRKIALCRQSDTFGVSGASGAEAYLAGQGIKAVATVTCDTDQAGIDAAVTAIAAAKAQAVVFVGYTRPAAMLVKALRARGSHAMVVTSSTVDPQALVAMLPREAATWLAVAQAVPNPNSPTPWRSEAVVREYVDLHSKRNDSAAPPSRAGLEGFIAGKIVVEAIRRAGSNPASADVLQVLEQMQNYDVGGVVVSFSRDKPGGTPYARLGMISAGGALLN